MLRSTALLRSIALCIICLLPKDVHEPFVRICSLSTCAVANVAQTTKMCARSNGAAVATRRRARHEHRPGPKTAVLDAPDTAEQGTISDKTFDAVGEQWREAIPEQYGYRGGFRLGRNGYRIQSESNRRLSSAIILATTIAAIQSAGQRR